MAPFDWSMIIPEQLSANCRNHVERQAWLDSLSAMLEELTGPGRCALVPHLSTRT